MLGDDKPRPELDETAGSAAGDRFDELLAKIEAAGGEITNDDQAPLFIEFGTDTVEIGTVRTVLFNLNGMDFQITRNVKNFRIGGGGYKKHLEPLTRPMIETKLKKKPELSDQWIGVDFEDMF